MSLSLAVELDNALKNGRLDNLAILFKRMNDSERNVCIMSNYKKIVCMLRQNPTHFQIDDESLTQTVIETLINSLQSANDVHFKHHATVFRDIRLMYRLESLINKHAEIASFLCDTIVATMDKYMLMRDANHLAYDVKNPWCRRLLKQATKLFCLCVNDATQKDHHEHVSQKSIHLNYSEWILRTVDSLTISCMAGMEFDLLDQVGVILANASGAVSSREFGKITGAVRDFVTFKLELELSNIFKTVLYMPTSFGVFFELSSFLTEFTRWYMDEVVIDHEFEFVYNQFMKAFESFAVNNESLWCDNPKALTDVVLMCDDLELRQCTKSEPNIVWPSETVPVVSLTELHRNYMAQMENYVMSRENFNPLSAKKSFALYNAIRRYG